MVTFTLISIAVVGIIYIASQGVLDAWQELDKPRDDYPKRDPWRNNVGKGE